MSRSNDPATSARLAWRWFLVSFLALASAGCGLGSSAESQCEAAAHSYSGTVAGAFSTDLGRVRALVSAETALDTYAALPASEPVTLCYLDAVLKKGGVGLPPPDRLVVVVIKGEQVLVVAGYRDQIPVAAP